MRYLGSILLWLLVTLSATLCGVAAEPLRGTFTEYGAVDGMAHNNIHDIYIDSQGYVWLCTWSGVSRFDGYNFRNYCTDPKSTTVRHNRFRAVKEDGAGNLWFRTYDDHIYRFTRHNEEFEDLCCYIDALHNSNVRTDCFVCTPDSRKVWVEFEGYGVVCFRSEEDNTLTTTDYSQHPLLGGDISHLLVDRGDNLWYASTSGRVGMITPEGDVREVVEEDAPIVDIIPFGHGVAFATEKSIWISEGDIATTSYTPFTDNAVTTLAADNLQENIYIGTLSKGVYHLTPSNGMLNRFVRGDKPTRVRDMVVDSHGTVWITDTRHGITRLCPIKGDYKHFQQKQNTVQFYTGNNSLIVERDDIVWIKMNHVGFGYYDRERDSVEPFYNSPSRSDCRMSNGVAIFAVDHNNVLWLSNYYERGLVRVVLQKQEQNLLWLGDKGYTYNTSFLDEARALTLDHKGNIWVGTKEGHLYSYDQLWQPIVHHTTSPSGEPLGAIYSLMEDSHHNIWVGTKGNGVWRLTYNNSKSGYNFKHYTHDSQNPNSLSDNQIYCIAEDYGGRIWFASYGGAINMLPSWRAENFVNTHNSFPHYPSESGERARYLHIESPERMLIATSEGLLVCNPLENPSEMRFRMAQREIGNQQSLQANDIIHILEDNEGNIWLSTYGGGLSRIEGYDEQGVPYFKTYTTQDALASNIVMATTQSHDGTLWLATEKGLSKFNPESEVFSPHTRYDQTNMVVYSEAAALTDARGRVIVGCAGNSLHIIDPKEEIPTDYDYQLRLTSVRVQNNDEARSEIYYTFNPSVERNEPITIKYDYHLFRIGFAALNFRIQDRVTYMYRLEGYDDEWHTAADFNNVYYSKVPHGHYIFRLKAYIGSPQHASQEIVLPIHITTPPWVSWWAWLIYISIALCLLWLASRFWVKMAKIRTKARMEQDMVEMKLKFFTNISHELRTPLTLILGGIEEVKRHETLSERAEGSLELSHKNAKRMLTLINQLLDFRKVVKNKMDLRVRRVDIVSLAKSVLDNFRDSAAEKRMELIFSFSHSSIVLWCDPERIESLLYNLLSNAMKFTHDKGRITLSVEQREGEQNVALVVSDTGIGIPRERLDSIFERFYSYASAVRGEVKGSGIGLSLCKEIVELHHGTIEVDSKVGVGTTFTTRLRTGNQHFTMQEIIFDERNTSSEESATESTIPTPTKTPEGARKVVLAEDNSEMRGFIRNNLADTYEVIEAENGEEALTKIRETHPDIIVTDLMMPNMDGIELTEKIRNDFEISHIPIIMLTARQTPEDRILAMRYGADGYITKPFSMELLMAQIDNLLTQRKRIFENLSTQSASNRAVKKSAPADVVVTNRDEEFLQNLMEWLEKNIENSELTIDDLANHLCLGRTTMYNKIKSLTGLSPVELINDYRLTKSEMLLRTMQFSVSEVAYKVGFSDPGYFSRRFKEQYKSSPIEYMKKLRIEN